MKTRTIVICGKGGIGKSTIASNLAATLSRTGRRVLQVGCDPKHDSCSGHCDAPLTTVMQGMAADGRLDKSRLRGMVVEGRDGVHCLEVGGPQPGVGCAGRAITLVLDFMREDVEFFGRFDIRIFDLLGDVVCGGFAAPMRTGPEARIFLVVSGELLPLHAANNIARGVVNLAQRGGGRVAGLIANLRGTTAERGLIEDFAAALGTRVAGWIPRDGRVCEAEMAKRAVVDLFPECPASVALSGLSEAVLERTPVIRSIYSAVKQVFETVLAQKANAFREVVLVEYPRPGIWTLGFITGSTAGEVRDCFEEEMVNVFVPTTPNPTSGFLLFLPRRDVRVLAMTVEEGLKMVVSTGIITPAGQHQPERSVLTAASRSNR